MPCALNSAPQCTTKPLWDPSLVHTPKLKSRCLTHFRCIQRRKCPPIVQNPVSISRRRLPRPQATSRLNLATTRDTVFGQPSRKCLTLESAGHSPRVLCPSCPHGQTANDVEGRQHARKSNLPLSPLSWIPQAGPPLFHCRPMPQFRCSVSLTLNAALHL